MTIRQAQDADWPRIVELAQAFFTAHPEAFDRPASWIPHISRETLDVGTVFVFTTAAGTVQAWISCIRDGDTLGIVCAAYDPALSAAAVKTRADQFAGQLIARAQALGITKLHGIVMKSYTAGVNYWQGFGLLDSLQTRQTGNGEAWEATVLLGRFQQGVA